jgi:hypothetical protein
MFSRLSLERAPVSDDVRTIAVNLEPRDRFRQHGAMKQRSLRARRSLDIEESRLQRQNLLETLDISSCDRQHSQIDATFERIS